MLLGVQFALLEFKAINSVQLKKKQTRIKKVKHIRISLKIFLTSASPALSQNLSYISFSSLK